MGDIADYVLDQMFDPINFDEAGEYDPYSEDGNPIWFRPQRKQRTGSSSEMPKFSDIRIELPE